MVQPSDFSTTRVDGVHSVSDVRTSPDLSVVVCCYNGAEGLKSTLDSLCKQTIRDRIEVVVVDDGSTPPIHVADVASRGAHLIRHPHNLGLGAARNTGIAACQAPIVAFTDDDCLPIPAWGELLLSAYSQPQVAGAGGPVVGSNKDRFLSRYYECNEPVRPLEADLGKSASWMYRLWLYIKRNVIADDYAYERDAYSLVGANFSFRRSILDALGDFDAGIRFGGEDEDLCHRLRETFPGLTLRIVPAAVVEHDYDLTLKDLFRRARAYGVGNARHYLKHKDQSPTISPAPLLWVVALLFCASRREKWLVAFAFPLLVAPRWVVSALRERSLERASYAYVQMTQEAAQNIGFATGVLKFRKSLRGKKVED
jgi:glycosyltransferase involved in cell wall biosynthesis